MFWCFVGEYRRECALARGNSLHVPFLLGSSINLLLFGFLICALSTTFYLGSSLRWYNDSEKACIVMQKNAMLEQMKAGLQRSKVEKGWVADWVSRNYNVVRSFPIYVFGVSLLVVLINCGVRALLMLVVDLGGVVCPFIAVYVSRCLLLMSVRCLLEEKRVGIFGRGFASLIIVFFGFFYIAFSLLGFFVCRFFICLFEDLLSPSTSTSPPLIDVSLSQKILNVGCGVGGPMWAIAVYSHAKVIGITQERSMSSAQVPTQGRPSPGLDQAKTQEWVQTAQSTTNKAYNKATASKDEAQQKKEQSAGIIQQRALEEKKIV
ncbi:hypothetical protein RHSIM_Rhsim06G0079000 [Rhododendron simsii]|uniref:Uncharacterized protein n=1 Tax=Rhododendron simsii TaxID=118357 RepID=A0A834LIL9_RHOSS|nr:hypothetical protein RHSIM_Rhsim06G0079000 [Rhododendron simsii]